MDSSRLPASFRAVSAVSLVALCSFVAQDPKPAAPAPAEAKKELSTEDRILALRRKLGTDPDLVDAELRAMDTDKMSEDDRSTWVRLARDVAVRRGDRERLAELRSWHDPFSEVALYRVLLAGGHVSENDFEAAKKELAQIGELERVNERDRRRYWALLARMAQMEGDAKTERHALDEIVHELQYWPRKSCQGCHDDKRRLGETPVMDVLDTWFGKRFVERLKADGDAQKEADAMRVRVAQKSDDDDARIRLAYALAALGDRDAAVAELRQIPWAAVPGREGASPRMMTAYP